MRVWLTITVVAFLACLWAGCSSSGPEGASGAPMKAEAAAPVTPPTAQATFTASGPITVENQVDLLAERDGVVAQVLAEIGKQVRKGEVLARFDDRQLLADRNSAQARANSIRADLKNWEALTKVAQSDAARAEQMWKAQLITKEQLDHDKYKAEAAQFEVDRERENLRSAEASLQSLELELAKSRVAAPFDGVVARRYIRLGQKVSKDERLFWVTAVAPMRVSFMLPEALMSKVQRGSELSVVPVAMPDHPYRAKVVLLSPVVDPSSGSIEVVAEIQGPTGELRPGMNTNIRLATAR